MKESLLKNNTVVGGGGGGGGSEHTEIASEIYMKECL